MHTLNKILAQFHGVPPYLLPGQAEPLVCEQQLMNTSQNGTAILRN
jgi:hypothetical protein